MTSDAQRRSPQRAPARRPAGRDLVVAGGALLYAVLGFLPWASVTYDVLGPISASGYGLSVLVPVAVVLLVAAAVWALLPVGRLPALAVPRSVVPAGLAALAFLLTLVTWLRSTDYGFEPVPLLALLVAGAVTWTAVRPVPAELRAHPSSPAAAGALPGGPPVSEH
ncbi:MAG: conserved rane protein of unknown function [Modestobacter sp.]|jgi:hypothetical protein|nr:conserved rane protein of unknown function [Modestobacter sp.]